MISIVILVANAPYFAIIKTFIKTVKALKILKSEKIEA
jgi:hypothetical protein